MNYIFMFFILILTTILEASNCSTARDTFTIGIYGTPHGILVPQDYIFDGRPQGFDISLYCQIAQQLNKKIIFRQVATTGFEELESGQVDMVGGTVLTINEAELRRFGFVRTDLRSPNFDHCLSLIYLASNPPPSLEPNDVLAAMATAGDNIGINDFETSAFITVEEAGFSPAQIVNLSSVQLNTTQDFVNTLHSGGPGGQPITGIYIFPPEDADLIVADSQGQLEQISCVPYAADALSEGGGIAFRKDDCELMLQVQWAMNNIIKDGIYANLILAQKLITNHEFNPDVFDGAGVSFLVAPTIYNDSIVNGFIPNSCLNKEIKKSCIVAYLYNKYCSTPVEINPFVPSSVISTGPQSKLSQAIYNKYNLAICNAPFIS